MGRLLGEAAVRPHPSPGRRRGLGAGRSDSYGLRIMRERAEGINADVRIDAYRGTDRAAGTCVTISLGTDQQASRGDRGSVMTEPASVLVVDDHDLIRQGLSRAFERQTDFRVAGQAGSVAEAIQPRDFSDA